MESLMLKELTNFSQFLITVFQQECKRHDFAYLSSSLKEPISENIF
jgi:hypothetical protein